MSILGGRPNLRHGIHNLAVAVGQAPPCGANESPGPMGPSTIGWRCACDAKNGRLGSAFAVVSAYVKGSKDFLKSGVFGGSYLHFVSNLPTSNREFLVFRLTSRWGWVRLRTTAFLSGFGRDGSRPPFVSADAGAGENTGGHFFSRTSGFHPAKLDCFVTDGCICVVGQVVERGGWGCLKTARTGPERGMRECPICRRYGEISCCLAAAS